MAKYQKKRAGVSLLTALGALLGVVLFTFVLSPTQQAKGVPPAPHTVSGQVTGANVGEVIRLAIRSEGADAIQVFVECRQRYS